MPSASVWAALCLLTVPTAVLANARVVEVAPRAAEVFWWTQAALPVLGAAAAARWTARTGRRRTTAGFGSALLAATLAGALCLLLSVAVYRWVIPFDDPVGWLELVALPAATIGGALGFAFGLRMCAGPPGWYRYAAGGALAALGGYLIFPTTDAAILHGTGGEATFPYGSHVIEAAAGGRFAIHRFSDAGEAAPTCVVSGPGRTDEPAVRLTAPVNNSHDATTDFLVAIFSTPSAGSYTVSCDLAEYGVQPLARGAAPAVRTWPVPVIVLLGALPGLVIVADTAVRRARRHAVAAGSATRPAQG